MRVLVLCDDRWHPGNIIRQGLAELEDSAFELDSIKEAWAWSAENMSDYPVVVLRKSDNITVDDESSWVSEEGEGRVCLLSPGHNLAVWQLPAYRTLVQDAWGW